MTQGIRKPFFWSILLVAGWITSISLQAANQGYDLDDFTLRSAQDLVDVCSLDTSHEHHEAAMAFCFGFFEGAAQYDNALGASEAHPHLVCEPENITRSQAVTVVVDYLNANPQYLSDAPIDAAIRALANQWPCSERKSCSACSKN